MTYEQSASIGALSAALAAAQGEMANPTRDGLNPDFDSAFATLAAVRNACVPVLSKNQIAVSQWLLSRDDGYVGLRTQLSHASGEWMASIAWMQPAWNGPQAAGSAWSYLRRYSLAAITGLAQEDDDGRAGERRPVPPVSASPTRLTAFEVNLVRRAVEVTRQLLGLPDSERLKAIYDYVHTAIDRKIETLAELTKDEMAIVMETCERERAEAGL